MRAFLKRKDWCDASGMKFWSCFACAGTFSSFILVLKKFEVPCQRINFNERFTFPLFDCQWATNNFSRWISKGLLGTFSGVCYSILLLSQAGRSQAPFIIWTIIYMADMCHINISWAKMNIVGWYNIKLPSSISLSVWFNQWFKDVIRARWSIHLLA